MTDNKANTVQEFEDLFINVDSVYDYAEAYHTMENYVLSGQKIDNKGIYVAVENSISNTSSKNLSVRSLGKDSLPSFVKPSGL